MLRWANPTHSFTRALVHEKSKVAFLCHCHQMLLSVHKIKNARNPVGDQELWREYFTLPSFPSAVGRISLCQHTVCHQAHTYSSQARADEHPHELTLNQLLEHNSQGSTKLCGVNSRDIFPCPRQQVGFPATAHCHHGDVSSPPQNSQFKANLDKPALAADILVTAAQTYSQQ